MGRKIIKQGRATLTISIPSKWAKKVGVKPGDELEVDERGGELIIGPKSFSRVASKVSFNISDLSEALTWRTFLAMYASGVDEMTIIFNGQKQANLIRKIVDSLPGFAIVNQNKKKFVLREVSQLKKEEFDTMVERIFSILGVVSYETLEIIKEGDRGALADARSRDAEINRLTNFCFRILKKYGYKDHEKTPFIYDIVRFLENLGDEYTDISGYLAKTKYKIGRDTYSLFERANELVGILREAFYKPSNEKMNEAYLTTKSLRNEIRDLSPQKTKSEVVVLYHLRKITDLAGYILESIVMFHHKACDLSEKGERDA